MSQSIILMLIYSLTGWIESSDPILKDIAQKFFMFMFAWIKLFITHRILAFGIFPLELPLLQNPKYHI
jgi:hypothetical protein